MRNCIEMFGLFRFNSQTCFHMNESVSKENLNKSDIFK